ncbi:MAG: triose-phosphate isomerase [Clostridiales Family XIII bacterium]|jgi:triosephosphate isomerase|nr:triose-phosphate isomerase [Clostridiales Family XIII bacterium]
MRQKFIAGNWKMYKTTAEAIAFAEAFKNSYSGDTHEVAVCAPFTQLFALKNAFAGTSVKICAQNMHFEEEGAYTGEISAQMLTEIGVTYCLIGHSERRQYFAETDESVNKKIKKAFEHGILPIVCIGELLDQRESGNAFSVVGAQIEGALAGLTSENVQNLVIAYEPVWAIGTGKTATAEQAEEMCSFIRSEVGRLFGAAEAQTVRVQYGGSVKPENAAELMSKPNIDGLLVGGASLKPDSFKEIIEF